MRHPALIVRAVAVCVAASLLSGCLAVAATTAVVGVTGAVVGTGVKATGAVVGAAIPDGKKKKKEKDGDKGEEEVG